MKAPRTSAGKSEPRGDERGIRVKQLILRSRLGALLQATMPHPAVRSASSFRRIASLRTTNPTRSCPTATNTFFRDRHSEAEIPTLSSIRQVAAYRMRPTPVAIAIDFRP